ncbi:hypothetical protein Cgig2_021178 [Carnegiea gigantea]|uniref:SF4 helicase domain-containing protein n=1 Tax=Carnegiea gigantea TaxID=171969 RepID=A0A9Q1QR79_9CARY|nr:hypothetical protein Cgig2_021178 [Carnegiea gigantea]
MLLSLCCNRQSRRAITLDFKFQLAYKALIETAYLGCCKEGHNFRGYDCSAGLIYKHFNSLCEDDCLPHVKWVLDLAKAGVLRHGVRGLVIDPYNELDHQRPSSMTETEYVSQMLTMIKRFAQHHSCHVWFVAHPRQLHNWVGDPPNLYDISGSAHFINKCDNGIVVHRNRDPEAGPIDRVQAMNSICVRKVRNKVAGTIGEAFLSYNRLKMACSWLLRYGVFPVTMSRLYFAYGKP